MYIIFGGTGFIGIHYTRKILNENNETKIILADVKGVEEKFMFSEIMKGLEHGRVQYIYCDVRDFKTFIDLPTTDVDCILNFAAIHREPGHEHSEYFTTNIPGAENVCRYAESVGCRKMVFTSSIAVYEPTEYTKNELTIPAPISAYGSSKLAAEFIHRTWYEKNPAKRKLIIVRPGVVYGSSEGGNVTRMINMIKKGLFVYVGNQHTRKASIYIKELTSIIDYLLKKDHVGMVISNAVAPIPPSVEDYANAIIHVSGWKRRILSMPYRLVFILSFLISIFLLPLARRTGIDPVRVKKLRRINNIESSYLSDTGYQWKFSLDTAFQDWSHDNPDDW